MMRLMGFNVTADNYSNALVEYLSKGLQCWENGLMPTEHKLHGYN